MSDQKSLSKFVFKDLKRKYQYLPQNIPNSKFHLSLVLIKYIFGSKGFRSVFLYRIINKYNKFRIINYFFSFIRQISFSIEIPYSVKIGEGFLIGHPECVVINGDCIIGKNVTIQQGVTLGGNIGKNKFNRETPIIGDNVFLGAGCKVLGPVIIGENCFIGANAVVIHDIPENTVAVGMPAKVVKKIKENYIEIENKYKKTLTN